MSFHDQSIIPTVSVWMITYNHGKFIRKCLESVIGQKTNFPIEIIIGEDCSKDDTRAIIEEFQALYPEIIKPIFQEKNVGAYRNAYEFCYPALRGTYIACIEADDYWTDNLKLQKQVDALENDKEAVACFTQVSVLVENEERFEQHWSKKYNSKDKYSVTDVLKTFNIVTCTLMFRNVYPRVLPYDPKSFPTGDVSLTAFLLLKGHAIFLDEVMAVYRIHDGGSFSAIKLEDKNLVFVKIFEQFLKEPLFGSYKKLLDELLSDRAYQAYCFEIKKDAPDKEKLKSYYEKAMSNLGLHNYFFPIKTFLRKNLYQLTGKSFGRKLN